jgi:adenosylmethionine---8-amino-7-oxononanoate aminotransferase
MGFTNDSIMENTDSAPSAIWHPYTRHSAVAEGLPCIVRGDGCHLEDDRGVRYIDAVSSWWACSLGHSDPRIIDAIQQQAAILQHSILGNLSHPPAEHLARRLADLMPTPNRHVLFSSDGASAVEAALKIALQHAHQNGRPERTRFVSIHEAYHGDTLGAVGIGYLESFHALLKPALNISWQLPMPSCTCDRAGTACPAPCADDITPFLTKRADQIAAVIVEPLCLGAAGMRMYGPAYLARLATTCRDLEIPLIVDEIAMGFGRTGTPFAFNQAGIDPDMVCLGKALTAGYLPMSALVVKDELYNSFTDEPADHTFYHGHTWSGNPIAAAAALAALDIYEQEHLFERAAELGQHMLRRLAPLRELDSVKDVRGLGLIGAVELHPESPAPTSGTPPRPRRIQHRLRDQGVLLRPLGPVLYLMPPLNIDPDLLDHLIDTLIDCIEAES